jgi:hypothetical protein
MSIRPSVSGFRLLFIYHANQTMSSGVLKLINTTYCVLVFTNTLHIWFADIIGSTYKASVQKNTWQLVYVKYTHLGKVYLTIFIL